MDALHRLGMHMPAAEATFQRKFAGDLTDACVFGPAFDRLLAVAGAMASTSLYPADALSRPLGLSQVVSIPREAGA